MSSVSGTRLQSLSLLKNEAQLLKMKGTEDIHYGYPTLFIFKVIKLSRVSNTDNNYIIVSFFWFMLLMKIKFM